MEAKEVKVRGYFGSSFGKECERVGRIVEGVGWCT